ncbi:MAG: phosphate/phosphite/phosphonate ABC transporter substrate-binding protein [Magnetococcales bacterium]|nr:phosphate/phosphite/phosphonate ABC transporter substrate-binding protein [Magnetococcales bacterium]
MNDLLKIATFSLAKRLVDMDASRRALSVYLVVMLALASMLPAHAERNTHRFGVLSQRSAVLTAEHWNPILSWISKQAGVALELHVARSAPESNQAIAAGEYDFVYSNTIFRPTVAAQGYQVILRPRSAAISSQIVTLENSPIQTLRDLAGREVGFPSRLAFVGYAVPMDHLLREEIAVQPVFGGNQEGIMGQLQAGRVIAAAVNSQVMRHFANREKLAYRVLWESQPFHNLPIAAHPRVPLSEARAVQRAFARMPGDPEGARVLETAAKVIDQQPPHGFVPATQQDYENYLAFYRTCLVKEVE